MAEEGAGMLVKGWLPTLLGYSAQVGQLVVMSVVVMGVVVVWVLRDRVVMVVVVVVRCFWRQ